MHQNTPSAKTLFRMLLFLLLFGFPELIRAQEADDETIRWYIESMQIEESEIAEQFYCDSTLSDLYLANRCTSFWTERSKVVGLLRLLLEAEQAHGLWARDYHYDAIWSLVQRWKTLNAESTSQLELLSTDALLLLTSHMMNGKVNPVTIDPEWYIARASNDVQSVTTTYLNADDFDGYMKAVAPEHDDYHRLSTELVRLHQLAKIGEPDRMELSDVLEPGVTHRTIPAIKDRMILEGFLDAGNCMDDDRLDSLTNEAVANAYLRYGIAGSESITPELISALNVPLEDRVHQVRVNLERWRWLPRTIDEFYINVNIASYQLEVIKHGNIEAVHKIISGRPTRKTPVFTSTITYLVLNPTWTVPPGILRADIIPAQRKNKSYLSGKNIAVIDRSGKVLDPAQVDWSQKDLYAYTYRQAPGTSNALGSVKFMFDNSFNIYIHDTPSKELFANEERALSSGCIRVERPLDLAAYLLKHKAEFTPDRIGQIVRSGKTTTIFLDERPNVYLLYWTAWVDSNGVFQFRKDVYERDIALKNALSQHDEHI